MVTLHKATLIILSFAIMAIGLFIGANVGRSTERAKAVCHSKTEDSVITDCNYSNGSWTRK